MKKAIGKNVYDIEMRRITNKSEKTRTKEINSLTSGTFESLSARCDSFMIDKIDWLGISNDDVMILVLVAQPIVILPA